MGAVSWLRGHRVAVNLAAGMVCFALYGYALYAEIALKLVPCPLCIFQRIAVLGLGAAFLLSALLSLSRSRAAACGSVVLIALAALAAVAVAGRHVYVQSMPAGTFQACGASLEALMDMFSLTEVLQKVLGAPGECANVDWKFLGISMPGWVLAWAVALGALGTVVNWPRRAAAA